MRSGAKKIKNLLCFKSSNKNSRFILLLSSLLVIFFLLSALSQTETKIDKDKEEIIEIGVNKVVIPKKSDNWQEVPFININNNWTKTNSTHDWCSGSGTLKDPYVISNVIINASGLNNGILINNSKNTYFTIKNCKIFDSGSLSMDAGIRLENTNNGTIINNNCSKNYIGIYLYNSHNNTILDNNITTNEYGLFLSNDCDNNTIYGNSVINNNLFGINISTTDCNYNLICNNNFSYNGLNAYDNGINNNWYNDTLGNYWHNYTGLDINDNGIGDNPYNISGSAKSKDYYPIWWDAPVISVYEPINNSLFGITPLDFIVTIVEGINDTWWYTLDNQAAIYKYKLNGTIDLEAWKSLDNKTYEHIISFFVNDSRGYFDCEKITIFKDVKAPNISINFPTPTDLNGTKPPDFDVSITEANQDSTWYALSNDGISWTKNLTFGSWETSGTIDGDLWGSLNNGTVWFRFYANDTLGNIGFNTTVFRIDIMAPNIEINFPTPTDLNGTKPPDFDVSITEANKGSTWYALSNDGISWTENLTFGSWETSGTIDGDLWGSLNNGTVWFRFYANDTLGNMGFADVKFHKDILAPKLIVNLPIENEWWNSQPTLNAMYSDPNSDTLWYRVYSSSIEWSTNRSLANNSDQLLDEDIWMSLDQGEFRIYFYANDTVGNLNETFIVLFKDTLAPKIIINSPKNFYWKEPPPINVTVYDPNFFDLYYEVEGVTGEREDLTNNTMEALNDTFWNDPRLNQGIFQIYIWVVDNVQGEKNYTCIILTLYKDTMAPEITINLPLSDDEWWNKQPTLNIMYFDPNNDTLWYRVNSSKGWSSNVMLTNNTDQALDEDIWNNLEEGMFQIYIYANDTLGIINNNYILTMYKDTLAPSLVINYPKNQTYWNNPMFINVTAYDQKLNRTWYRVYSPSNDYWSDNITLTNNIEQLLNSVIWENIPNEGLFQVLIYVNDSAGNINNSYILTLYKDIIGPRIKINNPIENNKFGMTEPSFSLTIEEANINSMWYSLYTEATDWSINIILGAGQTSGIIDENLWFDCPNGTVIIRFYADDTLGNITYSEVKIFKDIFAPVITIIEPNEFNNIFGINAPNFSIYVGGPVNEIYYSLYTEETGWSDNFTLSAGQISGIINQILWNGCGNGTVTIRFYINDTLGNIGYADVKIFKDIIAPKLIVNLPIENEWWNSQPTLNALYSDPNNDTLWYSVYSSTLGWSTNRLLGNNSDQLLDEDIWMSLGQGEFRIYFYANDTVGNLNLTYIILFKDTLAPKIIINSPSLPEDFYCNQPPLIEIIVYDLNIFDLYYEVKDVDGIREDLNNDTMETLKDIFWNDPNINQGIFQIYIWAVDNVQGEKNYSCTILTLYKDTMAPEITVNLPLPEDEWWNKRPTLNIMFFDPNNDTLWYRVNSSIGWSNNVTLTNNTDQTLDEDIWNSLEEGMFQIYIYANDTFGYLSSASLITLYKDTIAPEITINLPKNESYWNCPPPLNVSSLDPQLDKIWYRVNSSMGWSNNVTLTNNYEADLNATIWNNLPEEGLFQIFIYANDSAGNVNNNYILTLFRDVIGPRIEIISPKNKALFGNDTIDFDLLINDANLNSTWYSLYTDATGWSICISLGAGQVSGVIDEDLWFNCPNGTVIIKFYSNDSLGNIGSNQVSVFKDMTPPLINIIFPNLNDIIGYYAPDINLSIEEANLNCTWYILFNGIDPDTNGTFIYPITSDIAQSAWVGFRDGLVTIRFYANDTLGNIFFIEVNITKDTTAPDISILYPNDNNDVFGKDAPDFSISKSGTKINTTWYVLKNSTLYSKTYIIFGETGSINQTAWNIFSHGNFLLIFYINDTIGNTNFDSIIIYKDLLSPKITIIIPINDTIYNKEPTINLDVLDVDIHLSTIWYRVNSSTGWSKVIVLATYSFPTYHVIIIQQFDSSIWNDLEQGKFQIYFFANDSAGNINDTYIITLYKDSIAPIINIISPGSGASVSRVSPYFEISIQDDNLESYWYSIDDGKTNVTFLAMIERIDQTLWEQLWDKLSANAIITIRFYAIDKIGNIGYAYRNVRKPNAFSPVAAVDEDDEDDNSDSSFSEISFGNLPLIITSTAGLILIPISLLIRKSRSYHFYNKERKKIINRILFLIGFILILIFLIFAFQI